MKHPQVVVGFKRHRDYVGIAHQKMTETGTTSHK
jgi:hypothetical protein